MRRIAAPVLGLVLGLMLAAGGAPAQTVDPVELAFWQSIEKGSNPEEFRAYLQAYPDGHFASFARSRIGLSAVPLGQAAIAPRAQSGSDTKVSGVLLRPTRSRVGLVEGITLDLDAKMLRDSSNLRLAVVPAASPDAVADPNALVLDSTAVEARRLRLTVPSGPPGSDEVRLYHIPRFAAAYQVAARAPVTVAPGVAGALLSRDLSREAASLGPLRFEANHRDRPLLVQAAFLRARPQTEWNLAWFAGNLREVPVGRAVVISIGQPNVVPDVLGSTGEVVCVLSADDRPSLDRIAALQTGDPVLVRGVPTSWSSAASADPVVMRDCSLAG